MPPPLLAGVLPLLRRGLLAVACLLAFAAFPGLADASGQAVAPTGHADGQADGQAKKGADAQAGIWARGARFPDIPLAAPSPETGWTGGPDVAMPAPVAGEGLPARLSALRGEVFIINMYSWFCAPCQEEAPALRALDARIASAGLGGRVRLVGIAAGDDWSLVQAFRQRHGLVFPLFADPELVLHGQLGGLPVPFTWVLRRDAGGFRVLFTHAGVLTGTPAEFLDRVLAAAGPLP